MKLFFDLEKMTKKSFSKYKYKNMIKINLLQISMYRKNGVLCVARHGKPHIILLKLRRIYDFKNKELDIDKIFKIFDEIDNNKIHYNKKCKKYYLSAEDENGNELDELFLIRKFFFIYNYDKVHIKLNPNLMMNLCDFYPKFEHLMFRLNEDLPIFIYKNCLFSLDADGFIHQISKIKNEAGWRLTPRGLFYENEKLGVSYLYEMPEYDNDKIIFL